MRRFKIAVDGVSYDVTVEELDLDGKIAVSPSQPVADNLADAGIGNTPHPRSPPPSATATKSHPGDVVSPLAGTIIEIKVDAGQTVKQGDPLLVLEAMKMESLVVAPKDGRVQRISISAGQAVQEEQVLMSLE